MFWLFVCIISDFGYLVFVLFAVVVFFVLFVVWLLFCCCLYFCLGGLPVLLCMTYLCFQFLIVALLFGLCFMLFVGE